MKKKYYSMYKCPMCNSLIKAGEVECEYDELPKLLGKIMGNQRFFGNQYLYEAPMYIPHKCKNGDAGLAQFIGFKDVTTPINNVVKKLNFIEKLFN